MVYLNSTNLVKYFVYYGGQPIKGSTKKAVSTPIEKIQPDKTGSGLYYYGTGITSYGGSLIVGSGWSDLVKSGKKLIKDTVKKVAPTLIEAGKDFAKSKISQIQNPRLRGLANQGLETTDKVVQNALSGNKKLSSYADIVKNDATEYLAENKSKLINEGLRGAKKAKNRLGLGVASDIVNERGGYPLKKQTLNSTSGNNQMQLLRNIIHGKKL